jgi:hypothetical protein
MFVIKNFNVKHKTLYLFLQLFLTVSLAFPSYVYYRNLWDSPTSSLHINMLVFIIHCGVNVMTGLNLFRCGVSPKDSFELEIQKWFLLLYCIPASVIVYFLTYNFYPFAHSSFLYFYITLHVYFCFKNNG